MYTENLMSDFLEDLGKRNNADCISEILDTAVGDFEKAKRYFGSGFSGATKDKDMSIHISGIKENPSKKILSGRILVPRCEWLPSPTSLSRY